MDNQRLKHSSQFFHFFPSVQYSDNRSDPSRVAGGNKAAMQNPNVLAEPKEGSQQVVEERSSRS